MLAKYGKNPDRTTSEFEFGQPRLIAHQIGIDLYHEERSDGHQSIVTLDDPFRAIASPFGASIMLRDFDGRVLRFYGGNTVAGDTVQSRQTQVEAQIATAIRPNAGGYTRVGLIAQVLRNDNQEASSTAPFPNHITAAAGPSISLSRAHFRTETNYEHLQQVEDVDLSTSFSLALLAAPRAWGYAHDGIAPLASFRIGRKFIGGFAVLEGLADGLFLRPQGSIRVLPFSGPRRS